MIKIRAYLVDPDAETICEVQVEKENIHEYHKLLGCDTLDAAAVFHGNVAYVDDNGIANKKTPFIIADYSMNPKVLFGRALIVGNQGPEDISCRCGIQEIQRFTTNIVAITGDGVMSAVAIDVNNMSFTIINRSKLN